MLDSEKFNEILEKCEILEISVILGKSIERMSNLEIDQETLKDIISVYLKMFY